MHSHRHERVATGNTALFRAKPTRRAATRSPEPHRRPSNVKATSARERLLERVPAMIVELDRDGRTLFANEAVAQVAGYKSVELEGKNFWRVVCPGQLRRQLSTLRSGLSRGNTGECEVVLRTKDGTLKTVSWTFSPGARRASPGSVIAVGTDVTPHKHVEDALAETVAKLQAVLEGTIEAIAMTVELRDPYTAGHQRRVATLALSIADAMGLSAENMRAIRLAGTIHDIGKIAVPLEVLSKRDLLTTEEMELLKAHAETGYAILKTVEFPWPIADIVHQHHERIDGSGYPLGLTGDRILVEAKILAVCDVVESMAGPRPYRQALGLDAALEEVSRGRGKLYEPEVVDVCTRLIANGCAEWEV